MQTLLQYLRFVLRQLRKTPGFTFVAVLTLALGMGATTAIFSIIDGALRLPFPRADRLVSVKNVYPTACYFAVSYPDFIAWRQQNKTFAQITAVANSGLIYKGAHGPLFVRLQDVASGFFSMFGPDAMVTLITPVEVLAMQSIAPETTATELTGALGILALLLASIGVYGVVAYTVSRRTREFGIRMALGARRGQIVAMLLRSSAGDFVLGVAAGALMALPLNRWMQSLLGHEEGFYLLAFAGTALLLAAVALLATAVPARHAASIDPMTALRTE